MEHVHFRYMVGMSSDEVATRLDDHEVGVLSLADDGDAYAIPVNYLHEDGEFLLRLSDDGDSKKLDYIDSTDRACFLLHSPTPSEEAWSIVAFGTLHRLPDPEQFDDQQINERFDVLRVFDEDVADLDVVMYVLDADDVAGRKAAE